jgi:hypothetical protein
LAKRVWSEANTFEGKRPSRLVIFITGTTPINPNRTTDSARKPAVRLGQRRYDDITWRNFGHKGSRQPFATLGVIRFTRAVSCLK